MALSNALLDASITLAPQPDVAPAIRPVSAPVYVAPVSVPMLPEPNVAPTPLNQFRGEGGTPFGFQPNLYIQPIIPDFVTVATGLKDPRLMIGYTPPPNDAYNPGSVVPTPPDTPPRPGEATIQPVPIGRPPSKPTVAPAVVPVPVPGAGPISGMFLGLDLAKVPLWAWLVAAALVGARVLR